MDDLGVSLFQETPILGSFLLFQGAAIFRVEMSGFLRAISGAAEPIGPGNSPAKCMGDIWIHINSLGLFNINTWMD